MRPLNLLGYGAAALVAITGVAGGEREAAMGIAAAVATRLFCLSMALYCAAVTEAVAAARVKVAAANSSNSLFALLQGPTLSSTTCIS